MNNSIRCDGVSRCSSQYFVIVTPRTFIASISCVVTAGATPVFVDVDPDSGNIHPGTIAAAITERTKAVIPVHLAGWPCDMVGINALAAQHDIAVIEDCAQAHGAKICDQSVGTFGKVGAWSFCQDKIMSTGGEGGLVTTDDEALWDVMWSYKDHGKNWDSVYNKAHPPGFRWVHDSFGTNWRMLEMQAVIGRYQLKQMAAWTQRRTDNARALLQVLDRHSAVVRAPRPADGLTHAYYRLYGYVQPDGLKADWSRDRIVEEVNKRGVPLLHGSCSEVYREKAFDGTPWRPAERLPVARALGETSLMFLVHPTLTADEIAKTQDVVDQVLMLAAA